VKSNRLDNQDMSGFGQGWSGNAQLFWRCERGLPSNVKPKFGSSSPNINLSVPFNVRAAGTYEIVLHYTTAPDYCSFIVFLDGQSSADIDGRASTVAPKYKSLGQHKLTAGRHELKVETKSCASEWNHYVGLDRLELRPPSKSDMPSPPTTVKKPGT
jgi:hypothetical protein